MSNAHDRLRAFIDAHGRLPSSLAELTGADADVEAVFLEAARAYALACLAYDLAKPDELGEAFEERERLGRALRAKSRELARAARPVAPAEPPSPAWAVPPVA